MVGLVRFGASLGLVGAMALGVSPTPLALAESFHLRDGRVIEAEVLRGTLNTLTLRVGNTIQLVTLSQIKRVSFELADGETISGRVLGWKDGVFEVEVTGERVQIVEGQLVEQPDAGDAVSASAESERELPPIETVVMTSPPFFVFADGETVAGRILYATGSVVTFQPFGLTAAPKSKAQISQIYFDSEEKGELSGKFIDWKDGTYHIQVDDRLVLAELSEESARKQPSLSPPVPAEPVSTDIPDAVTEPSRASELASTTEEETDDRLSSDQDDVGEALAALQAVKADAEAQLLEPIASVDTPPADTGAGGPANETVVAALSDEGSDEGNDESIAPNEGVDGEIHRINALVDAVDEGGVVAVFKFELSKPANRPLVVLYAATEASAKAGEDFEAKSGVITFATGSDYAEVEVPIIDDDKGEENETFNLFLSGDPKSIAFGSRQIAATITDND